MIATVVSILLKKRLRFRVVKAFALDHPVRKCWFVRSQSQDHLNILLNVRCSRFSPGY